MATLTDIANIAISAHQGAWLQNVESDPGNFPDALRATLTQVREEALSKQLWKFAKTTWRAQTAVLDADNPSDQRYFYRMPANCVRIYFVPPGFDFYEWEGGVGLDEGPQMDLVGNRADYDIGEQSPAFNKYMGLLWAWYVCTPVNASEAIRQRCEKDYEKALAEARHDDSKAGTTRRVNSDAFLIARTSGWPRPTNFI